MENEQDLALERVFQAAFALECDEEAAFWSDFLARRREEEQAWLSFAQVMIEASVRLRQAAEWASWPARGLPGIV